MAVFLVLLQLGFSHAGFLTEESLRWNIKLVCGGGSAFDLAGGAVTQD